MKPPRKRLKLTVEVNAHDWRHAEELLREIRTGVALGEIRGNRISGAGYTIAVDEDETAPGEVEYKARLAEWMDAQ